MLTDSAGTLTVTRTASIESQLSVDAGPLSNNLTACSGNDITSVFDRRCQKVPERQQSEPRGTPNDETTHLHISNTCPVLHTQGYPEDQHGIDNNAFSLSSSQSTSSLPNDWKTKLNEYDNDYCDIEHDVMILYSEDDRIEVEKFKIHLETEIKLPDSQRVNVVLYDELSLSGLSFDNLELAFNKCAFTFVFITKSFAENTWCKIISESCLMKIIHDSTKGWRVVPVYTKRIAGSNFPIPMGLNALKGINYYNNDEYYRKGVARLINESREKVKRYKQKRSEMQNKRNELLTSRRQTCTESREEGSSVVTYTEQLEATCALEDYRQSNIYFNGQMQPDSIEMDDGTADKLDSLLCEDNGQTIHCSYQTVLVQENTDTQENIEKQKQDEGKRSQVENNNTEDKTQERAIYFSGGSNTDLSAMEVDSESIQNNTVRERPVGVVRPNSQTTSGSYRYCHIWQYCAVHGRHYKVFEWFYKHTTTKEPPDEYDLNTID